MQLAFIFAFVSMVGILSVYFLVRLGSLISRGEWLTGRSMAEQKRLIRDELFGPAGIMFVIILALAIGILLTNE